MNKDIDDVQKSDWYRSLEKLHNKRKKTLKKGDNVIHLEYLGGLIGEDELHDIEGKLKQAEIELSRYDYSGFPQAALEDYLNVISILIQPPLITNIMTGVLSSFVWDSIKYSVKKIWFNIRQRKCIRVSSKSREKKRITFGVEVKLNEYTGFNFRLDGDFSEEIIDKCLDKVIVFLKKQPSNDIYRHPYFMTYNTTLDNWEKLDVEEDVRKEILKRKSK